MSLLCSNLTGGLTILPANSGFFGVTDFSIFGSITSSDINWVAADKFIKYDLHGVGFAHSTRTLITSISTNYFYENLNILNTTEYYELCSTISVSSQDTGVCTLTTILSDIGYLYIPDFISTVSATNVTASGDSTFYILQSSIATASFIKDLMVQQSSANELALRLQTTNGLITSFYPNQTFNIPITEFGLTVLSVTGFPLLSSYSLATDDYIDASLNLGLTPDTLQINTFLFVNNAYAVSATLDIYPKYTSIITTTGYSPYKSVYPQNTGTIFTLNPNAIFTNYSNSNIITSVNLSWLTEPVTSTSLYDTLTSTSAYYNWNNSVYPYVNREYSIFASISGPLYTPTSTLVKKYITFVDPPSITLNLSSSDSVTQDNDLIVERNVVFQIGASAQLPYAYVFKNGLPGATELVFNSPTSINLLIPDIYTAGTPYTAQVCAFPLLSAIPVNELLTQINYITGSTRTLDTGVLPIVKTSSYIISLFDNVIPADNLQVDLYTSSIQYNNNIVDSSYSTNISTASAFIYKNQFNETIVPELSVVARVGATSNVTIQDLYNSINGRDEIYLNVTFNNKISSSIFSLTTLTTAGVVETPAPLIGEIIVTARSKDSLNITTKTIPYSGYYYDFITPTLYFNKFTPSWYASYVNPYAFEVIVWNDNEHTIDQVQTYVIGSSSYPYNPDFTRYSRLIPQWWFQDSNGNKFENFPVNNIKLYNAYDGTYIGTSGIASFYFKDDSPTGPQGELLVVSPVVSGIVASVDKADNVIDRPSYANSKQSTTQIYFVSHLHPTKLNITRDGIRDLKSYYWYTNPIPNTITLDTIQTIDSEYGIDFSYPYDNGDHLFTIGLSSETIYNIVTSPETTATSFTVSYFNSSFKATDSKGLISTGFARTSLSPTVSSGLYKLVASTTVYPSGQYSHTPYAWVSDNKNNLVSRLYYNDITKECSQNEIKQQYMSVPVSGVTNMLSSNSYGTDIMSLTGVADAGNIAIDSLYNAWVVDGGNDVAYKINVNGEITKTITFPTGSTPGSVCVDGENNVWFTLVDDVSALKYNENGEFLASITSPVISENYIDNPYKPAGIDTDLQNNVWVTFYNSVCSIVGKYTSTGTLLTTIPLPPFYSPTDIIIDGVEQNTAWVISENNSIISDYHTGAIHKISNNTSEIILSGFNTPEYFNIDANRNLWLLLGNSYLLAQPLVSAAQFNARDPYVKLFDINSLTSNNGIKPIAYSNYEPGYSTASVVLSSNSQWVSSQVSETGQYQILGNTTTLWISRDYGATWSRILLSSISGFTATSMYQAKMDYSGRYITITTLTSSGGRFLISRDYGYTWSAVSLGGAFRWHDISGDGSTMIIRSTNSVLISRDYGNTFTTKSLLPNTLNGIGGQVVTDKTGKHILLTSSSLVSASYISQDFGNTWTAIPSLTGLSTTLGYVAPGAMSETGQYQIVVDSANPGAGIYKSTDYGTTWSYSGVLSGVDVAMSYDGRYVVIVNNNGYVYESQDYGETFNQLPINFAGMIRISTNRDGTYVLGPQYFTTGGFYNVVLAKPTYVPLDFTTYNQVIDEQLTNDQNNYTGIGGHSNGDIWVLNNKTNKTLIITPQVSENIDDLLLRNSFNIYPTTPLSAGYNDLLNIGDWNLSQYIVSENPYFYQVQNATWDIGIQARGDWTGLRRALKYCPNAVTSAYTISGASETFEIKTSPPGIRTLNDSYDLSSTLSKIFPEILSKQFNPVLHNEFLPGALGTDASDYQTIGRQFFEKIANFVRNHNDIDFCNVNQLYNIAAMLNVSIDDYNLSYPPDVRKALDVLSIQHKRLFGDIDNFNRRFSRSSVVTPNDNITTIQSKLNYNTTTLPATTILLTGTPLVVHDLVTNKFDLLYINQQTELRYLSGYGLRYPVFNFDANIFNQYKFYNYKPNETPSFTNSFIDWNSTYTTLLSSVSSIDEWYKDDGIVDQVFNYYLNKGLGFINT